MNKLIDEIMSLNTIPVEQSGFDTWLEMGDALSFLEENARDTVFVARARIDLATFMHTVLVPLTALDPPDAKDLLRWDCTPGDTWRIRSTYSEQGYPEEISWTSPLEDSESRTIAQGEQIVFSRHFQGRIGDKHYVEVLQKFAHLSGLHFIPERNAYCRLDENGDLEDAVTIIHPPESGRDSSDEVVVVSRRVLDEYLAITESAAVRTFDLTRLGHSFSGWPDTDDTEKITPDLCYRLRIAPGYASSMRGIQIIRSSLSKQELLFGSIASRKKHREYVSFLAYDFKHNEVRSISTDPGHTSNYFMDSDLPFELSPAFFRPDVLLKYKGDSEKYTLHHRTITCRGSWHLQTYDINEEGQVHSYICYLRHLPYSEQIYWKSFNEHPKGPISKRAFMTDIEGRWDKEYDPLLSLKELLTELIEAQVPWWKLRSDRLPDQVHYPVTASADEWADEILRLDQFVVEGFVKQWLEKKAELLGRALDPAWQSLILVRECLIASGLLDVDAEATVAPLRQLHALRSKVKGHASKDSAVEVRKQVLAEFGSYKNHFRDLSRQCDESMRTINAHLQSL